MSKFILSAAKNLTFLSLIVFPVLLQAQDAIDLSCRAQAKDLAVQTYQSCVTDARGQKIEEIRKEYQTKLNELKSYYNTELKKASGNKAQIDAPAQRQKSHKTQVRRSEIPKSGVPKSLPKKQVINLEEPEVSAPEIINPNDETVEESNASGSSKDTI